MLLLAAARAAISGAKSLDASGEPREGERERKRERKRDESKRRGGKGQHMSHLFGPVRLFWYQDFSGAGDQIQVFMIKFRYS
jgi:hypothetical protein